MDEKGIPTIVDKAGILPPKSSMSAVDASAIQTVVAASLLKDKYAETEDRESAYEIISEEMEAEAEAEREAAEAEAKAKAEEKAAKEKERARRSTSSRSSGRSTSGRRRQSMLEKSANAAASTIGREVGKQLVRGLLGNFLKR